MTPAQRVWSALKGEPADSVPFTVYELFLSQSSLERKLRNQGVCIVKRVNSYYIEYDGITHKQIHFWKNGKEIIQTLFETPLGILSALQETNNTSVWTREHLFKSADDYKRLLCLIKSMTPVPQYDVAAQVIKECGEDFVIRDNMPLEPLQQLISSIYMDMTVFCYEWIDNRDEILKLYDAFTELNRKIYPIVADGPMGLANYGGNVIPQIIGRDTFKDLYMPHYAEAAEILHKKNKLLGCHFDADNTPIMDLIGKTALDYIEAYDPGMSPPITEALKIFNGKAIWINWPSAWHMSSKQEAENRTYKLLQEVNGYPRFLLGVTEDIAPKQVYTILFGIMAGIEAYQAN
jgi:hypothetical protein